MEENWLIAYRQEDLRDMWSCIRIFRSLVHEKSSEANIIGVEVTRR